MGPSPGEATEKGATAQLLKRATMSRRAVVKESIIFLESVFEGGDCWGRSRAVCPTLGWNFRIKKIFF